MNQAKLPVGTIVRVTERGPGARQYVGRIVGYDMWRSKYEIGQRYGGWGEWLYSDGGSWAFASWVEAIDPCDPIRTEGEGGEEGRRRNDQVRDRGPA